MDKLDYIIDEIRAAIAHYEGTNVNEEEQERRRLVLQYLLELKDLRQEAKRENRNTVIDEFVDNCSQWVDKINAIRGDNSAMLTKANIVEVAQKMKAKGNMI